MRRHRVLFAILLTIAWTGVFADPFLTGVIEDADAQTIEMPVFPGAWQSQIEWMAPEGSEIQPGDVVIRLDPGSLLDQEERTQSDYERKRFEVERRTAELALTVMDAETAVLRAESELKLATLDANIPATASRRLDYDRAQLRLSIATQSLERKRAELVSKHREETETLTVLQLEEQRMHDQWQSMVDALEGTQLKAEKAGILIYAENRFTGHKIFPGETYNNSTLLARIASHEDTSFRFWVHEADILKIVPGDRLVVTPDALPEQRVVAVVSRASQQATTRDEWSQGGYFEVHAKPTVPLPNTFIPGMSVMGKPE